MRRLLITGTCQLVFEKLLRQSGVAFRRIKSVWIIKPGKMYNVYWYRSYTLYRLFRPAFSFSPVLIQCN